MLWFDKKRSRALCLLCEPSQSSRMHCGIPSHFTSRNTVLYVEKSAQKHMCELEVINAGFDTKTKIKNLKKKEFLSFHSNNFSPN